MATPASQAYRDGDTRVINGVNYVRTSGRWIPSGTGAAPSAGPALVPLAPPDPARAAAEQRAAAAEGRAARAEQRSVESHQREMANGAQMAVEERKAAAFLRRAVGAEQSYRQQRIGPRSLVGQNLDERIPNVLNTLPGWIGNSPQRQVADTNQDEFIAASLRQDSGAAIPPEELERQRRIYFPMPGDGPEAIAAKRAARRRAIEGLRDAAGRALTPELEQMLTQWQTDFDSEATAAQPAAAGRPVRTAPTDSDPNNPLNIVVGDTDEEAAARQDEEARRAGLVLIRVDPDGVRRYGPPPGRGGSGDDLSRMVLENSINSSMPLLGPMTQAIQGTFGPESANAFLRGGRDVSLLGFADEVGAGIGTLGGEDFDSLLARERATDAYDYNNNFGARLSGQLVSGALLPTRAATMRGLMAESAAFGGAYGLGSGEGGNRVPSALVGVATGALAPPVVRTALAVPRAVVTGARSAFGPVVTPEAQAVARAAQEEGVTVSRPIVDETARTRMARLEASVGGNRPVQEGLAATERGIDERASQLAAGGTANERGAMGQRIQTAANRHHGAEGQRIGRIYDAADTAAAGATVEGRLAVEALDGHLARLRENPRSNAALIRLLEDYRSDFVDDAGNLVPKTIGAIRDLRTNLRGQINERNLATSNAERMVSDALDAAGRDIQRDLSDIRGGRDALRLYNQADRQWRARAETRRQIVERVIGPADNPISGSQVMDRVRAMTRGDTPRLRRLWRMLEPEERQDAAATIAAAAGRRSPEEDFSPAQFMSWARTIEPSAREVIFGPEGARSIANLVRLSTELKNARGALNNSRSGMVQNWSQFLRQFGGGGTLGTVMGLATDASAVTTGAAGLVVGGASAGVGALSRFLSARALMNPDMTRWLAAAPRARTPGAIRAHINRLADIAARDPAIAQEATGLHQYLLRAANDNVERSAAASDPDQEQQRR